MTIDPNVLTSEDHEYAETWTSFLPYVDLHRRLSIIAQIHHDLVMMEDEDGVSLFQTEAEVRVACSVLIVKSDVLNDVRACAVIYRYLQTLGVDVEDLSSVLTARYKSEDFNSGQLPAYVVTSPLTQYRHVADKFIGDGTVIGFGQGQEAELFISMKRPPAVFLIGGLNSPLPRPLIDDDYVLVFTGSSNPKDSSYGVSTYVRRDCDKLTEIINNADNIDITDI